jgi:hypothetical protein
MRERGELEWQDDFQLAITQGSIMKTYLSSTKKVLKGCILLLVSIEQSIKLSKQLMALKHSLAHINIPVEDGHELN